MIVIFWCEYHRVKSNQKYKCCRLKVKSAESDGANLLDENLGGEGGEDAGHHRPNGGVGDGVVVQVHHYRLLLDVLEQHQSVLHRVDALHPGE